MFKSGRCIVSHKPINDVTRLQGNCTTIGILCRRGTCTVVCGNHLAHTQIKGDEKELTGGNFQLRRNSKRHDVHGHTSAPSSFFKVKHAYIGGNVGGGVHSDLNVLSGSLVFSSFKCIQSLVNRQIFFIKLSN